MSHEAQIIILEHIPTDAELFELQLRKANIACSTKRVATKEQFLRLVQEYQPDLVIADISMPKLDPLTAMEVAKEVTPGVPWILISPPAGEELISECFRRGAADFISKKMYPRIGPAVRRALERKVAAVPEAAAAPAPGAEGSLPPASSVPLMSSVFDNISDLIAIVDLEGRRLYNSPSYRYLLEEPEELKGTDSFMDIHPEDREKVRSAFHDVVRTGKGKQLEYRLMGIDGEVRFIESRSDLLKNEAEVPAGVVIVSRDITARKRAEESLIALVASTSKSGDEFFPGLVRHLAGHLAVRFALVAECIDASRDRVRVLSYWADGRPVPSFEYDVAGTTCEQVVKDGKLCYYPADVQGLFPREKALVAMNAYCYLGVPLMDEAQCPIGHLFVMDDKPLADPQYAINIVNIFAARAGEVLSKKNDARGR
jgi:PAS domain S-box-containing protein